MDVLGGPEDVTTTTPTNEQLANFASVTIFGPGYPHFMRDTIKELFDSTPYIREQWLRYHAEFQQDINKLGEELRAQENDHV